MKRLQGFSKYDAIKALRDGVQKGYWTVDSLDQAPPGTAQTLKEWSRHPMAARLTGDLPQYRNLLRDVEDNQQDDFVL